MSNVHVGIQIGRDPANLVRADASEARWDIDIDIVVHEGQTDFRGAAVQGKRGERFIYLTWGDVSTNRHVRDVPPGEADAEPDRPDDAGLRAR